MPQIKTLTVNNGSVDVSYTPAGSDSNATLFVNRGTSLKGVSKISASIATANQSTARGVLKLDKKIEQTVEGVVSTRDVALFDLRTAQSMVSTRGERVAALNEFRELLGDPDVINFIVDHEAFY